jgi:dienelactone hydrolase
MRFAVGLAVVTLLATGATTAATPPLPARLAGLYAYDRSRPLSVRLAATQDRSGVVVHDLTFASPKRGRVPAYLVVPSGRGPFPAVLMQPGSNGDRDTVLEDLVSLARRGVAGMALTPPQIRPDGPLPYRCVAAKDIATFVQYVVEARRALDVLGTRPEIDARRIAYSGFSLGSQVGAVLSAVEPRVTAVVLQSAVARATAYAPLFCSTLSRSRLAAYTKATAVLDPVRYITHAAPTPLLIQNGRRDSIGLANMQALRSAASNPKTLQWFPSDHGLTPRAFALRDDWLLARLGARP